MEQYEQTRFKRSAVGTVGPHPATAETAHGTSQQPASPNYQWDVMDQSDGRTVARYAGTLWEVDDDLQSLLSMAESRDLAANTGQLAEPRRPSGAVGLGNPLCGRQHCPCASTRGRRTGQSRRD